MKLYSKIKGAIKAYIENEGKKVDESVRRQRDEKIRDSFRVRRTESGNYYLMCGNVYIERYEPDERLETIENRIERFISNALRYDREEYQLK